MILGMVSIISHCCNIHEPHDGLNSTQKLEGLCKLWGFAKYYHPTVGAGSINWDSVLVKSITKTLNSKNTQEYHDILLDMIPSINYTLTKGNNNIKDENPFLLNLNISFLSSLKLYSPQIIEVVQYILMNKPTFDNAYIQPNLYSGNPELNKDTAYTMPALPKLEIRLLALFRYWNIINYFYPYKYLLDDDWNNVLTDFIPVFIEANDTLQYHLAVRQLIARVDDNHVFARSQIISNLIGKYSLPIILKTVEGQHVIYKRISDSLCRVNNLNTGDIIHGINGKSIGHIRDSLKCIIAGSSENAVIDKINLYLCKSRDSLVDLTLIRNDSIIYVQTEAYLRKVIKESTEKIKDPIVQIVSKDISYINLKEISYNNIDSIINIALKSKIIIIDLRDNCSFIVHDITKLLLKEEVDFYSVMRPDYDIPGVFNLMAGERTGPKTTNFNYFKGDLLILVNENTQSIGEFTAMALSMHPNSILIGNNTAGADGNVSIAYLPGGIKTNFTGLGIYYPNFILTQRVGLKPNIVINTSISAISQNIDEVLNYAIELGKTRLHSE